MSDADPRHNNVSPEPGCGVRSSAAPGGTGGAPEVSICIPTFQHADQVRRLLESIAAQTFRDYEVVIADDSGNEEVAELVRSLLEDGTFSLRPDDEGPAHRQEETGAAAPKENGTEAAAARRSPPRLRYYRNGTPLGHIYNWNRAIDLAEGALIKIMFSDDWFTFPDSLERMAGLLRADPEADLAFCGSRQTPLPSPDGTPPAQDPWDRCASPEFIEELRKDYRYLFLGDEIGAPSATIFRAGSARFVEGSSWASDMFLYFGILSRNPRFAFAPEPLVSIGIHGGQYTDSFAERDIRKYQDDRAMYERYDIGRNEACRRKMLHRNVMYRRGRKEAMECGASLPEYLKERVSWFYTNTILGYWNGLKNKINKIKNRL